MKKIKKLNKMASWSPFAGSFFSSIISSVRDRFGLGMPSKSSSTPSQNDIIDSDSGEEEMGDDDVDDEICFGTIRGNIVGIQYYRGTVNSKEMVALQREPHNKYDSNAIRVNNVDGIQVGHIKRELAKPLAYICDTGIARIEGVVPYGTFNMYSVPVDLTLWGLPKKHKVAVDKLKQYGYSLTGGASQSLGPVPGTSQSTGPGYGLHNPRRTYLTPAEVKNELDKLFENIKEEDKTSTTEPAEAVSTKMYPHQKQALNWMIKRENGSILPPFWEESGGKYFNSITNFTSNNRPKSVQGGILADDMGLGKTLEMIALILTNFEDNKTLAVCIPGTFRESYKKKLMQVPKKAASRNSFPSDLYATVDGMSEARLPDLKFPSTIDSPSKDLLPKPKYLSFPSNLDLLQKEVPSQEIDIIEISSGESDYEDAQSSLCIDDNVMLTKNDPNFSPKLHMEHLTPRDSARPKGNIGKVVCYVDMDSDEDEETKTPIKRARINMINEKALCTQQQTTLEPSHNNRKGNGKVPLKGAAVKKKSPSLEANTSQSEVPHEAKSNEFNKSKMTVPKEELPEIQTEVALPYGCPGMSKCDQSTGRAMSNGPRTTLIVCPSSVISNWLDQLERHVHESVHLDICLYCGVGRIRDNVILAKQDIVLTTYSTLAADHSKGNSPLEKVEWLRIVLDEGHAIRNPNAKQTKAILALNAQRKWVLTGTPIQNSMKDLWSLVNFLQISPFTDQQWWHRTIERPLKRGDESALKRVQHLMSHIALRRTKTQKVNNKPLVELPERKVYLEHITLSREERDAYDSMQNEGKLIVNAYFKQGTLLHNYGDVLAILMRLRQLCCHPFLVAKVTTTLKETHDSCESSGGQLTHALQEKLIGTLITVLSSGSDEECAICLDGLKSPVITHCAHVYCRPCIEAVIKNERPEPKCPLCRGAIQIEELLEMPPEGIEEDARQQNQTGQWKSSTKVDVLMNALLQLRHEDPTVKSIVVSQFTSFLKILELPLSVNGFKFVRLDGSMNTKARTQAMEEFNDNAPGSPTIILLSFKAGGVGINLTAASRVFLLDPAWNPASEEQCFDRCHRLGQTKEVIITKFIVEDSVETRMMALQEKKRQLMQRAFGHKESDEEKRQARIRDIKSLMDL
ncbi:hypothetical protein CHS0354_034979 [Potamilus streckersoni]|uniref:Helicase-like transcription factor n=1 Tax=Potamilus streckersoni TaxID=2493646 RepID=A0AAE0SDA9_9BIVA|nr:hypothetical protein CHS0354_034979 [Potamilus streckersoni]